VLKTPGAACDLFFASTVSECFFIQRGRLSTYLNDKSAQML
jgi:hypothetical protein